MRPGLSEPGDCAMSVSTDHDPLPESLPVQVLMARRPGATRWQPYHWQAVAVVLGEGPDRGAPELMIDHEDYRQLRYGGLQVRFHVDEAADYYHNLTAPAPGCYVVAASQAVDGEEVPVPVLVTLNFDEAHAYGEGDLSLYHVPIGPELYPYVERFVVTHYVPERKHKRKLKSARAERGYGEES